MVKMNGKVIFNGTLLAGLLICTSIGHYITNSEATPSMKIMEKKQQKNEGAINMKEIEQAQLIEKVTEQLKKKGYQVGFILSIYPENKKEIEAVVRSETKDKEKTIQEITRTIDEIAKENKLGVFNTIVNFPDE
ncbi:hypothetical protein ACIQ4I_12615 [Rummeliibacillus sp. NPDC094406]|uniref:hypothetical protein n=1 Tax=Rummeliibacillus sp. NPDC094406 TaxID=3364511 RepID=UPI00382A3226